jgi:hypothetical protein
LIKKKLQAFRKNIHLETQSRAGSNEKEEYLRRKKEGKNIK